MSIMDANKSSTQPIAIIGMACRLPGGASSPSKLWDFCAAGRSGWSKIPPDRFDVKSLYDAEQGRRGRSYAIGGHFLDDDISRFDATFFNMPADVASAMDPQIRLLLEVVYEATEDAGIPIEKLAGSNTSVFSGCYSKDYYDMHVREPELMPASFLVGNYTAMFANRISHLYDLQGPSFPIDTGCSAGLVALDQGCQSIRSGVSDMSIVGASNLILNQDMFVAMANMRMVGAAGKCYAWDARAEGYGRGEGVSALILKSLEGALRDGDEIHAVIRETAVNQDGKTTNITSPSMEAQVQLIKACYQRAGLDLSETGFVEAHMTGTQVGDATEAEALAKTFGGSRLRNDPIPVGSVKTNIGHLEPVSGLASIIKAAFMFKNRQVPPNLNYELPNPKIPLDEWHLQVPTSLTEWPQGKPLRASINNFGYGGTNAHVILEAAPEVGAKTNGANGHPSGAPTPQIYVISAKDSDVCLGIARRLSRYLRHSVEAGKGPSPSDLAYTLLERRSRFPWSIAIRAHNLEELIERLSKETVRPVHATKTPRLGFVFNGQGAQWYAMGRELITTYPSFASSIHKADQILQNYGATWSLYQELMRDESSTRVAEIALSQPISVALQLCLVDLLRSWTIEPSAVSSHSSGEIAAAYTVGALSFQEALGVVYFRGELAQKYKQSSPPGGMLAAGIGPEQAEQYIANITQGRVGVACINSPHNVTLSGDLPALDEIASLLQQDVVFARKLKVPVAYHSHHMLPMASEYEETLRTIIHGVPKGNADVDFASPVTGGLVSLDCLNPDHWVRNLTSPVRFSEAFESMCHASANVDMVVEIGAHSTLAGPIRQILNKRKMPYASCLKRSEDAVATIQELVSQLLVQGYPVDVKHVNWPLGQTTKKLVPDLPSYQWNHNTGYWLEPRASRETRYKKFAPHELLGLPLSGGHELVMTWRNFLRFSELPWLLDHQVDGRVVLPGAAYLSMAIEAVHLLTGPLSSPQEYRLREVNILNGLTIPETSEGVEVHTTLRPCPKTDLDCEGWYEFQIDSVDSVGSWITHCQGYVSAQLEHPHSSPLYHERETPREDSFFNEVAGVRALDVKSIYATMRHMSLYHGPSFQNLTDAQFCGNKIMATVSMPSISTTRQYIIHPATLDTVIQVAFGVLPAELTQHSVVLPRSIGQLSVPANLSNREGGQLKAFTELRKVDQRGAISNTIVSDGLCSALFRMEELFCQAIPLDIHDQIGSQQMPVCSKSRWEIDIQHQIPSSVKDSMRIPLSDDERDFEKKLRRAAYYFIYDAVAELSTDNKEEWQWHHKVFYDWMEYIVSRGKSGSLCAGSKSWARASRGMKQMLNDELQELNAAGKLTVRVGAQLARIVRGEITPLEVMMADNNLNRYYMELPRLRSRTYKQLSTVVELYAVKNPGANVLEIGAGTGGATQVVLEAFGAKGDGSGSLVGHYTFTDVSGGFFEAARQKLAVWDGMINFATLDIEVDPTLQSFTPGSYDLIVASMVLHATKSLKRTLCHVRSLLRPGGRLVLIETTQDRLDMQLIFGTFSGWWLSEEPFRKHSPNVSLQVWDDVLKETGFSGVDFDTGDYEASEFQGLSVILTTASTPSASYPSRVSIVYTSNPPPTAWMEQLSHILKNTLAIVPTLEKLEQHTPGPDKVCIFTAEMIGPLLKDIENATFMQLKNLLVHNQGVLWLSCGAIIDSKIPAFGQTQGLLRTLRQEHASNRYVQLDFDSNPWSDDQINYISHVLQEAFDYDNKSPNLDWEYVVKDSTLYVPRVYVDPLADPSHVNLIPQRQPFYQEGRPLVLEQSGSGALSNLYFTDQENMSSDIPAEMVQIEAKAFGLNLSDVILPPNLDDQIVSHEFAGVVTALGPGTESTGLEVGDRVCGISQGRFATASQAQRTAVARLPDDLSWEDGAALPYAYITARHSLVRLAGLREGEVVLIHAAASSVGQAAIAVAQHLGADLYVTCGTDTERDALARLHHVDPSRIFSSTDESFVSAIMAGTNGKGVDVVLNSLTGPLLKATWNCMARFGRFIELGKADIDAGRGLGMAPFGRCAMYTAFDILQFHQYNGSPVQDALVEGIRICQARIKTEGVHVINSIQSYLMSEMENAMSQIQNRGHTGKLVLIPRADDQVISRPMPLSLENPDATYLVVGGLGGIGRAITHWMLQKGAQNVLLVSRNAEGHPDALDLLKTAKSKGRNLWVQNCDVSDKESLVSLLAFCDSSLPPIRGVINCAMVLDDSIMERMTFEQWQPAVQSKVATSANLHQLLPNLSFFIMLSSLIGVIGNVSQANYAAGNTFQDALARARRASGQPAVSLCLNAVESAGYVATDLSGNSLQRVKDLGTIPLDIEVILRLLEAAVLQPRWAHPDDSQVLVGLAPWDRLPDGAAVRQDRRFGTLRLAYPRSRGATATGSDAAAVATSPTNLLLRALQTLADSAMSVAEAVAARLGVIFNLPAQDMDLAAPLAMHGVDSLVAVELRNWLFAVAKAKVSVLEILRSSSLMDFATLVIERSSLVQTH